MYPNIRLVQTISYTIGCTLDLNVDPPKAIQGLLAT